MERAISCAVLQLTVALCVMNPFGDDDEDFQTSSILDYNLEVSFRSVYMDPRSFPDNLSMPLALREEAGKPNDLQAFLDQIDCDLSKHCDHTTENK
ncbi:unnamed protein product [Echinostoma caproni]|uniref:Bestrophin homolog n=1 Tax=Echinostoma caproni TaxID=27848 RepID=A0A183BA77_9TREM|nr:unnamed protein product [Echinostoma caproni]